LFFSTSDNTDPITNGRTYTAVYESPLSDEDETTLRHLAEQIRLRQAWSIDVLQRLVRLRQPAQRAYVFEIVGRAFIGAKDRAQAAEQLVRAWTLGREPAFEYLIKLLLSLRRFDEVRPIVHRAFIAARQRGDVRAACDALLHHHAAVYATYAAGIESPIFQDPIVIDAILDLLIPYRPTILPKYNRKKIRVGYLLTGEGSRDYNHHPEIAIDLSCSHDKTRIDPVVLTTDSFDSLAEASPFFVGRRERLAAANVPLIHIPWKWDNFDAAVGAADAVAALDLDVLVTNALSDYAFLLAALRPARRLVGIGLGEVTLYTSPILDSCVQFTLKPGEDALCDTVITRGFISDRRLSVPGAVTPVDLGLPPGGVRLFSGGRAVKFHNRAYWELVARVLAARPDARLVVCGIDGAFVREHPAAEPVLPFAERVHGLGWRNDYLQVVAGCDIVLDTFPQGGGWTLFEPMSLGIPVIGYRDPPLPMFREATWNPALEFFDLPGAVFDWWEPDPIIARVLELIDDPVARREAGEAGRAALPAHRDVRRVAADFEAEFRRLLEC
jgi:glycosyltransferase involved in cell wall biosynthesis